jgi:hypothetical protein
MRGQDEQQLDVFSYVSPEQRVPHDHPLRPLRVMTDEALRDLQPRFHKLYAKTGRPSICPNQALPPFQNVPIPPDKTYLFLAQSEGFVRSLPG